ncbi:MAG: hypothetical protein J5U17_02540 [Candidatus Methanoperedens sp.]|nr:hypothetical protein [Candidatus Methanoperedens sp.]MCE8427708.1 hypothetical protein [Candidatus Methanoperedens sp.]
MKPISLLIIILASVIILSFAIVLTKEDILTKETEFIPPPILSIRDVDVSPLEVTSAQIEVNVTAYINHAGGKTTNASMVIRAISGDTGLLGTSVSTQIPEVDLTDLEKTIVVSQKLKLDRNNGYDLKLLIFNNGSILDSGSVNIRGLNALIPASKKSGVVVNNIDFTINNVSKGKVAIKSDIYLENKGAQASENVSMIIKAREASSNLLTDKTGTDTGIIASEATAIKSVQLAVPDEYNYMIVVELWKGDVLINTWEKPVLLAPTKTVPKETIEKKVDIEVSKFARESAMPGAMQTPAPYYSPEGSTGAPKEPGFEVMIAIGALLSAIVLIRRSRW